MPAARDDQRPLGVVYTPPEVAGPMVRLALDRVARGKAADEILALRVCDPAIGEGAFLVQVVDALAEHLVAAWARDEAHAGGDASKRIDEARQLVARTCIAGVEIDALALARACMALGLDDGGRDRLLVADALELDWKAAFPDVFARGGFDVVVGNPPYIRQESLGGTRGKSGLARFATFDGTADLYVYFLELAHQVMRPGGVYCLIVPTKWMTVAYGRKLRAYLAAHASLEGVVDLARVSLFDDADAFPCIVWGTVGRDGAAPPLRAVRAEPGVAVADALAEATGDAAEHPRERWDSEPWHIETGAERALLDRITRAFPALADVMGGRPARGVVTGLNRAFVIDRETRDRLLDREPGAERLVRPFVKGRDVRRWMPEDAQRWVLLVDRGTTLEQLPVVREHLDKFRRALEPRPPSWTGTWGGRKPGAYAWYELQDPVGPLVKAQAPRLLYQDIQTGPACALDRSGSIVPDTTVWMLPTEDRYLLALLNSPLYGWYARRRFPPALNGAVRPKLEYMRALPVAPPSTSARRAIEALVERRLTIEADLRGASTDDAIGLRALARELDAAVAAAIADVYELSTAERRLVDLG